MSNIVVIQRFFPNFREVFFDNLYKKMAFKLIVSKKSVGKIVVPEKINDKVYIYNVPNFVFGSNHVLFIFLFIYLIKLKPQFIITEGGANTVNNFSVWLYCKLFNCKYAIWDLGKFYKEFDKNRLRKIYDFIYNFIMKGAYVIFAYNTLSKKYFEEKYTNKKVTALGNTIDTNEVLILRKEIDVQITNNLKKRFKKYKYLYMYVGAINHQKGLEKLMLIHSQLTHEFGLIIIGKGKMEYIEKLLKRYFKDVFFEGYKNLAELAPYYSVVDFTILPGLGGLSISQSMAFSTPVICTKADGTETDLVIKDKTGYIYNNINDAIAYIKSKNKQDWEIMGKQAEKHVYSKFSIDSMVNNFIKELN